MAKTETLQSTPGDFRYKRMRGSSIKDRKKHRQSIPGDPKACMHACFQTPNGEDGKIVNWSMGGDLKGCVWVLVVVEMAEMGNFRKFFALDTYGEPRG